MVYDVKRLYRLINHENRQQRVQPQKCSSILYRFVVKRALHLYLYTNNNNNTNKNNNNNGCT